MLCGNSNKPVEIEIARPSERRSRKLSKRNIPENETPLS
jgi:hypothetical protein